MPSSRPHQEVPAVDLASVLWQMGWWSPGAGLRSALELRCSSLGAVLHVDVLTQVNERSVITALGRCMCHKHFAPMAEGYITQFLFKLANQRLAKAHVFVDIRIVVPLNLV